MAPRTSRHVRSEVRSLIDRPRADVLVIGAGINGVAIARDLALNGVDVILVDRSDVAAETSAASSRMVHGGVRYLENGEFRLVKESVEERNRLLANAPHHVKPLPTTIPIRNIFGGLANAPLRFLLGRQPRRQRPRGALLIKTGLWLYDAYSNAGRASDGTSVPRHRFVGRARTFEELPDLHPATRFTATYFDAMVARPERYAWDLASDAARTGGLRLATYVEAVGHDGEAVTLRDGLSGHEWGVLADVVVNASGPFADLTNAALGERTAYMGGTKGSHIVVDNPELLAACRGREIFFENSDGRIVLVYPMHGKVILGTTDIPADPADPVVCTDEEVDYFLELAAHVFPEISVSRDQIVFRYAGIRPLPAADATEPGRISRDYRVEPDTLPGTALPVLSVVGGKWTTHRALGEQVGDRVLALLGLDRFVSTDALTVGASRGLPRPDDEDAWVRESLPGVGQARGRELLARYGTDASGVARAEAATKATARRLRTLPTYSVGEISHVARTERVVRLADVALRRTTLAFEGLLTEESVDELADVVGDALHWSRRRRRDEVELLTDRLREAHGVDLRRRHSVPR